MEARSSCASGALASDPGEGTGLGRDHTIFATRPGMVDFQQTRKGRVVSVKE